MKPGRKPLLIIVIITLAAILISRWDMLSRFDEEQTVNHSGNFDRIGNKLTYTKHALCRMDCRFISKTDVEEIMRGGEINYAKSDMNDTPCPTYAVQGHTSDNQHIRVIFAQCSEETKVVTCYDLEKDFECFCPGDEKKKR